MNDSRENALFTLALAKSPAERAAFLDRECGEDTTLRARIEALLAAHEQTEGALGETVSRRDEFHESPDQNQGRAELGPPGAAPRQTIKLALADVPDERIGQKIGHYKILEKVGEGGCGVVYVAEQTEPVRRRVALKVIKLGMDTKQVVARFEAERQALAMMDHPNIAKVLDAGSTDTGRPYFIMELVRGIKITDYCDQEKVGTRERLELFIKVCQAIQHAHQKGIIHRDIKPSNILVTLHDGVPVPKVIDFGIAKATEGRLTDNTVYTQLHQFIGTPAYMSPEQAEMSGLDIDTRSDIYSLGVLLYELLTGKTPFDAQELMSQGIDAMRKTIREKEPQRPSTKLSQTLAAADVRRLKSPASDTPSSEEEVRASSRRLLRVKETIALLKGDLDWIVMKCLEKDRTRRYDTANGLAMDLKRHLNNETVVARPPSKLYEFQRTVRRHKVGFAATAAVIVVLAIGIVMTTWQAVRATQAKAGESVQRQKAEANEQKAVAAQASEAKLRAQAETAELAARRRAYAANMNVAQQALRNGNLGRARELLNGHIPKDGEPELRGFEWRYLWGLSRGNAEKRVHAFEHGPASCLSYSPDGKVLAAADWFGHVNLWRIDSEDGVVLSDKLKDGSSGRRAVIRESMAFSNNGKLFAMALEGELIVWDVATWKVRANLGGVYDSRYIDTAPVEFLREDQWIATRVEKGVMLRNLSSNEQHLIPGESSSFGGLLAWCSGPNVLAIADGTEVQFWDPGTQVLRKTIGGSDSILVGLVASRRGDYLAAGRKDGSVDLISVAEERVLRTWKAHASLTFALDFSPDGLLLATGGADQSIHLWELGALSRSSASPQPLRTLLGHESQVWALRFSPDGRRIASVDKTGWLALWRSRPAASPSESTESSLEFDALPAGAPTFMQAEQVRSPDNRLVANRLTRPGSIEVRDAQSGQLVSTFPSRTDLASMAISPSNKFLAAGAHNTFITLFETATAREILVLRGHLTSPSALAFSRDERTLASGGTDGTVKLWSLETGQEMISLSYPHGTVANVKFSKDGETLGVQFAESPTIEYLHAPSWAEINAAEARQNAAANQP